MLTPSTSRHHAQSSEVLRRGFQAARIYESKQLMIYTQPAALDFVKTGQLTNLLCKGTFPQEEYMPTLRLTKASFGLLAV